MIIEQLKKELSSNSIHAIEFHFYVGDSVVAREIDYSTSTESFVKVIKPIPMFINLRNVLYIQAIEK
ncbi:TPA: hypothetical protein P1V03_002754 [Staphylococcus aureus]|nr:hypothetical protein [Staphylococcus aureus]